MEKQKQAPDQRAEKQHKQNPGSFPDERSDRDSIGRPVQLDEERPGAERQRPPTDREKRAE